MRVAFQLDAELRCQQTLVMAPTYPAFSLVPTVVGEREDGDLWLFLQSSGFFRRKAWLVFRIFVWRILEGCRIGKINQCSLPRAESRIRLIWTLLNILEIVESTVPNRFRGRRTLCKNEEVYRSTTTDHPAVLLGQWSASDKIGGWWVIERLLRRVWKSLVDIRNSLECSEKDFSMHDFVGCRDL